MQLSRGWRGLLLFWAGVGTIGGVGAATLEMLGPPADRGARADPTLVEFAARVPATVVAAAEAAQPVVEAPPVVERASAPAPEAPVPAAETEVANETTVAKVDDTPPADAWAAVPELKVPVASTGGTAANEPARQPAVVIGRKLHLRIFRDSEHCPKVACYKWRVLEQRLKPPRPAGLDMAGLRLAPELREQAEQGKIELIVDAVEHHKTVNGHDSITLVATGLSGVTPH